jgi:hypothetical protein
MIEINTGIYRHYKTKQLYIVTGTVLNTTNDRDGQVMVEYYNQNTNKKFVRELSEFIQELTEGPRFLFVSNIIS